MPAAKPLYPDAFAVSKMHYAFGIQLIFGAYLAEAQ